MIERKGMDIVELQADIKTLELKRDLRARGCRLWDFEQHEIK